MGPLSSANIRRSLKANSPRNSRFARRPQLQFQRVDAILQFGGQHPIDSPLARDARLARKDCRLERNPKVRFTATVRICAGVSGVPVRIIDDLKTARRKRRCQFVNHTLANSAHGPDLSVCEQAQDFR